MKIVILYKEKYIFRFKLFIIVKYFIYFFILFYSSNTGLVTVTIKTIYVYFKSLSKIDSKKFFKIFANSKLRISES